jgi:pyridoxal biosynthesis lyase PdxS
MSAINEKIIANQRPAQMLKGGVIMDMSTADQARITRVSEGLGEAMSGHDVRTMPEGERLAVRGS